MNTGRQTIRWIGSFTIVLISCISCMTVGAPDTAAALNYSDLSLTLVKTYTDSEIRDNRKTLTAKEGNRFVIVVLRGTAPKGKPIKLAVADFRAKRGTEVTIAEAIDFNMGDNGVPKDWLLQYSSTTITLTKPSPFFLNICFSLEKNIDHFELFCGDYAAGAIEIQSQGDSPKK